MAVEQVYRDPWTRKEEWVDAGEFKRRKAADEQRLSAELAGVRRATQEQARARRRREGRIQAQHAAASKVLLERLQAARDEQRGAELAPPEIRLLLAMLREARAWRLTRGIRADLRRHANCGLTAQVSRSTLSFLLDALFVQAPAEASNDV